MSLSGLDIGDLPAVADPERKARAVSSFQSFCETNFPQTFHLPWSRDHLKVIRKIEPAVLEGGLFALAMPRGSGKTTIAECACVWAILFGHREFVALIRASEIHAADNWKPSNERSRERIDGIVALIMALDRATTVTPVSKCWYTRGGLRL
ncbi:MAG: hypothetical protein IT428_21575 [Planctomycetaceae bacterium]|nr:hypothetical protein [Planctomycetaceae bacterium]